MEDLDFEDRSDLNKDNACDLEVVWILGDGQDWGWVKKSFLER